MDKIKFDDRLNHKEREIRPLAFAYKQDTKGKITSIKIEILNYDYFSE